MGTTDSLLLNEQLCFPLYALSREITGLYRPLLEEHDLTYPQYLVMLVLWEQDGLAVCDLGSRLLLDSGTLTPLLKRLELKGFVTRKRCIDDERVVHLFLTDSGRSLREQALDIPAKMLKNIDVEVEELNALKITLNKIINQIQKQL
jgi:DNA-binding MarR family transcriptional regulator